MVVSKATQDDNISTSSSLKQSCKLQKADNDEDQSEQDSGIHNKGTNQIVRRVHTWRRTCTLISTILTHQHYL